MDTLNNITYFIETCNLYKDVLNIYYDEDNSVNHSKNLNDTFKKEYLKFIEEEKYFPGCPLGIYKKTYSKRLREYKLIRPDSDEFDFLKEEWDMNYRAHAAKTIRNSFYKHLYPKPHLQNLELSTTKVRDLLGRKIIELDHYIEPMHDIYYDEDTTSAQYERDRWNLEPVRNQEVQNNTENACLEDSKTFSSKSNTETTATQWALYHYVLQEAKIKPRFAEKKKEFQKLEKEYGKHWNNLQSRWNRINNSDGEEGYSIKDLNVVEDLLTSDHPEAVRVLKEISSKLF